MLCIRILGRFAPLVFVVLSHSVWLCSFKLHAGILDCFALSDFVLLTRVYYIVGHFAPMGFGLCTRILSCFAASGFTLCARILGLFAPSSLALSAHILLALLTHVLRFALTNIFEKISVSQSSRNALKNIEMKKKSIALWAYSVALLPQALHLHSWSLCSPGLHVSHLHSQSLRSLELCARIHILARFAPYPTSVHYIVSRFTSSGFLLRTRILSYLATSSFALAFFVTSDGTLKRGLFWLHMHSIWSKLKDPGTPSKVVP